MNETATSSKVRIAPNRDAFLSALFKPGSTFDGYIERVLKSGIRIAFRNETYVLNTHGVFCLQTVLESGRKWFSYGGELNRILSIREREQLAESVRALAATR